MTPGAHKRIARAGFHHFDRLRLAMHLSHDVAVRVRSEIEALVILGLDIDHRHGGQHGLPQAFIIAEIGQQRAGGAELWHRLAPVLDLQRKDDGVLLPSFQIGAHPIAALGGLAAAGFPVPRDAEAPAALQLFADGDKAVRQAFIRVAFQTHHARARDRTVHKPGLRAPVVEGFAAGQRIDQRGGRALHRKEGVRHAVLAILARQLKKQVILSRA